MEMDLESTGSIAGFEGVPSQKEGDDQVGGPDSYPQVPGLKGVHAVHLQHGLFLTRPASASRRLSAPPHMLMCSPHSG
jgi:hypothetical protein